MSDEEKPRIRTHEMVSESERRKMPAGLKERAYYRNRPSYMRKAQAWTPSADSNSREACDARRNPKFKFIVPEWLLPKNGIDMWHTITASIVWGICGRMADMESES